LGNHVNQDLASDMRFSDKDSGDVNCGHEIHTLAGTVTETVASEVIHCASKTQQQP